MRTVCMHSANYGKLPRFDCKKAERELGIKWVPLKKTLHEMAARELELVRIVSPVFNLTVCQPLMLTLCTHAQGIAK